MVFVLALSDLIVSTSVALNWWLVAELRKNDPNLVLIRKIAASYSSIFLILFIINTSFMMYKNSAKKSLVTLNFFLLISLSLGYTITGFASGSNINIDSAQQISIASGVFSTMALFVLIGAVDCQFYQ